MVYIPEAEYDAWQVQRRRKKREEDEAPDHVWQAAQRGQSLGDVGPSEELPDVSAGEYRQPAPGGMRAPSDDELIAALTEGRRAGWPTTQAPQQVAQAAVPLDRRPSWHTADTWRQAQGPTIPMPTGVIEPRPEPEMREALGYAVTEPPRAAWQAAEEYGFQPTAGIISEVLPPKYGLEGYNPPLQGPTEGQSVFDWWRAAGEREQARGEAGLPSIGQGVVNVLPVLPSEFRGIGRAVGQGLRGIGGEAREALGVYGQAARSGGVRRLAPGLGIEDVGKPAEDLALRAQEVPVKPPTAEQEGMFAPGEVKPQMRGAVPGETVRPEELLGGEQFESAAARAQPASTKPVAKVQQTEVGRWKTELREYEAKRFKTANDEIMIDRLNRKIAADPSKWQEGQGVAWNVTRGQVNRGFRVVEVRPETKQAVIRQVADTGLTSTGSAYDRVEDQLVDIIDLKRDTKYDSPIFRPQAADMPASPTAASATGYGEFFSGTGGALGHSVREADLLAARKSMASARAKYPEMTDAQAAATPLGQQIARYEDELRAAAPVSPPTPRAGAPEGTPPPQKPPAAEAAMPTPREQLGLGGFEDTGIVPPRVGQPRLPGEAGQVPPQAPPRTPQGQPPIAPEPPPAGAILPRFPSNAVLEARMQTGGWLRTLEQWGTKIPGGKRVVEALDPWAAAASRTERVPLVFRQMEAMGGDIVRDAMAHLEVIRLPGVQIKGGRFIGGVTPKEPGLSLATSDVLEHLDRYNVTPELRQFVTTANALNDDLLKWAKTEGVKLREMKFEPGGHYFGRLVREVRDIEKRGGIRPDQPRHYDTMEAGMDAGVRYEDDLLATAQAGYSWLLRKITSARIGQYAKELGRTPKQLIDQQITARAVDATQNLRIVRNYDRTLRAMRDGMAPTFQVQAGTRVRSSLTAIDRLEPGVSKQVIETWERIKEMPAGAPARQGAFKQLLADAQTIAKRALGEYKEATEARAKALRGLQSPEYAEGERFGLPKGTIGVGRVYQGWAAGRVFPRQLADYLNETFGETSHRILKAFDTVSGTSRTLIAGFDFGTTQIQLQGIMFSRPKVWAKAFYNMLAATANPQVYHAYMARPETAAVLKQLIPHGLTIEGAEYAEAVQRGGALQKIATRLGPRVGAAIESQVLKRADIAFTGPLNIGKIELAKALLPTADRAGQLDELAMFLNNVTGTRSSLAAGIGPGQRSIESAFLFFSPRFTRSSLALVGDALQGGLKGREARRALASLLVGGAFATAGLRLALGQPGTPQFFDPSSPDFMTAELFGRRVGLGGPYRAMAVTLGNSYKLARQDPTAFLNISDRRENPLTRWWQGRSAPVTSLLWDVVERRDFLGEPLNSPEAWARRGAKMIVPMAGQEFIPEPGQKRPEAASILPDILGLRAVPLSPAMERDRLRDQYARQEYGEVWKQLDSAKQAALEAKQPELVAAEKGAIETYGRRGSLLHEFRQDTARQREEPINQIAALTEQLRAGRISGYEYRKAVQEREAQLAQVPTQLQRTAKYQDVPLKQEEWKAWSERHGVEMPERQAPVDVFLDDYYQLTADLRDPTTGELDPTKLVKAREALRERYPANVVAEATTYLNRNRDPELVKAQADFAEYMRIPKYRRLSPEQGEEADRVGRFIRAYSRELGSTARAKALASRTFGKAYGYYILSRRDIYQNPERKRFRQAHPLIDKYYSRESTVEFRELAPAASR